MTKQPTPAVLRREAAPLLGRWRKVKTRVDDTPLNAPLDDTVLKEAIEVSRRIDAVRGQVLAAARTAASEDERTVRSELRALGDELLAAQKWFLSIGLPTAIR